ncbi:MAG TPA: hypothetical protein VN345_16250 [Blastocatellia bacterium]|jgi:hypothetical protein|nr:hypothetical protein [Blastocatellia bacterium]
MDSLVGEELLRELIVRGRAGFNAFCATIDLLGMSRMVTDDPTEARTRLDNLQQGFGDGLLLFPGGADYRVCFAADSLFVVKEFTPEEN